MASQTSYYAGVENPTVQGGRFVIQVGHAKFMKKGKTVSIRVAVKNVANFDYNYRANGSTLGNASGVLLRCTGTVSGNIVTVSRTTLGKSTSGTSFWYEIIGW